MIYMILLLLLLFGIIGCAIAHEIIHGGERD
jgi:hypothetical protein